MGCYNSAVIEAPVADVWSALRNFHDLSWSSNVVTSLQTDGDPESPGAKRTLNDAFMETLLELNDDERSFRYSIDDGPGPLSKDNVAGYVGTVRVFPVTDRDATFVLWTSDWESGGEGAAEFCNPIYQALLADLQAHFS